MQNCSVGTEERTFIFIDFEPGIYIHHIGYKAWEHYDGGQNDTYITASSGFFWNQNHGFGSRSWSTVLLHNNSCALLLKCLSLTLKFSIISILAIQCFYQLFWRVYNQQASLLSYKNLVAPVNVPPLIIFRHQSGNENMNCYLPVTYIL